MTLNHLNLPKYREENRFSSGNTGSEGQSISKAEHWLLRWISVSFQQEN
jgi:hypothetical protein